MTWLQFVERADACIGARTIQLIRIELKELANRRDRDRGRVNILDGA